MNHPPAWEALTARLVAFTHVKALFRPIFLTPESELKEIKFFRCESFQTPPTRKLKPIQGFRFPRKDTFLNYPVETRRGAVEIRPLGRN